MGCTQPTSTIAPINHVPIERIFVTTNAAEVKSPPVVMITAEPTPPYIKSLLKKGNSGMQPSTNILSMINSKPPPLNKVVSFDGQVLVRDRTPTPKKAWYEKASRTMPMRKRPRNDNDDYDYDDEEEVPSGSSDDDDQNENTIKQPLIAPLQQLVLPPQWNRPDTYWPYRRTSQGFAPVMNYLPDNEFYPTVIPQSTYDLDQNRTDYSTISKGNNIKVRRRVADNDPIPISSYTPSSQPLLHSPYSPFTQPSNFQTTESTLPQSSTISFQPQPNSNGYNYQPIENII